MAGDVRVHFMSACAVVGGQFGSEGKGAVVGHIAKDYEHHVRVGAANAGHTVYTEHPTWVQESGGSDPWYEKHVMQQLPCAAYANPNAILYIGPGAQISQEIFDAEMERLTAWREERGLPHWPRIYVDPRAHVITQEHIDREQRSGLAERIGSTSTIAKEGIGAAQAARVMRDETCCTAQEMYGDDHPDDSGLHLSDVPRLLNRAAWAGESVLLEGTQGTGLSLTTGDFPYCTSRNTTAAGLCADAGLAPTHLDRVILVVRSYPIRVAGQSGPFAKDSVEISWRNIGVDPEKERTTVTKKVRRVATFSLQQVYEAAQINGATEIALMFADYLDKSIAGVHGTDPGFIRGRVGEFVNEIEQSIRLPVTYVGTGPHSIIERFGMLRRYAA